MFSFLNQFNDVPLPVLPNMSQFTATELVTLVERDDNVGSAAAHELRLRYDD